MIKRKANRANDSLRPIIIEMGYLHQIPHSVMFSCGHTKVLCVATFINEVPRFKKNSGEGWLSAEYAMLPNASKERINRERYKVGGRTMEIQRLIGRSLRSILDFTKLGENTINIDADVIQADGGTRTASITASFICLRSLISDLLSQGILKKDPIIEEVAAVSVGLFKEQALLDLDYDEDCNADVDMNVVMTSSGKFIEIQGTAEHSPFSLDQLQAMLGLAKTGISDLILEQQKILKK